MNATAEKVKRLYECHNSACALGSRKDPGRFTDGITAEALNVLTGDPVEAIIAEGRFGEGFCPTCGEPGVAVEPNEDEGETGYHEFDAHDGDPHQDLHDQIDGEIRAAVNTQLADPANDTVTKENVKDVLSAAVSQAQPMVEAAIAEREAALAKTAEPNVGTPTLPVRDSDAIDAEHEEEA